MTIKLTCPHCGSKMNAPDAYLGKKGKCAKCGNIIRIQPDPEPAAVSSTAPIRSAKSQIIVDDLPALISSEPTPRQIDYDNVYAILSPERVIAFWQTGPGWQVNTGHGFMGVRQASDFLPTVGDFVLIEGNVRELEEGHRLLGARFYKLTGSNVLNALTRGNEDIFKKITGRVSLGAAQKRLFLRFLREHYFPAFTEKAAELIDYLTNEDFHSTQLGDCEGETGDRLPE